MNARIIFLSGIHGVGKGSLADYLSKKLVVPNYSSSSLIKLEKNKPVDSSKRVLEPTENQDFLVKAIRRLDTDKQTIILDGHFVLLTSDGFFNVPIATFKTLPIDLIILKVLGEEVIQERLLLRDGEAPSIEILKEHQDKEIAQAKNISRFLKIELIIIETDEYENVDFNMPFLKVKK